MKWFWVDFDTPNDEDALLLKIYFDFHPFVIEVCLHFLQRPKLNYYDGYNFFVLHTLNKYSLAPEEFDIFVGHNFTVTFHESASSEIGMVENE
ncbi:CorA family divalent cation transporter [Peribacillus simplex]